MGDLILNIGLNNNPYAEELRRGEIKFCSQSPINFKVQNMTYMGEVEPTLIVRFNDLNYRLSHVIDMVERLCLMYTQEAIGIRYRGTGILVYNPTFDGEIYSFDNSLFMDI